MKLQPYPVYKDSGVVWLGKVPEHWKSVGFRSIASVRKGRQPRELLGSEGHETGIPYLSMRYLRSPSATGIEFAIPQPDLVIALPGDTILLWDGANAGEFLRARHGVVSSTAALTTPQGVDSEFFFYACKIVEPTLRALTIGMGIPHVDGNVLKNLHLAIPPLPEQAAIVRFLDHADRRIRRYIRAKQKLIKLLEEQKQAIIHRAVTRGLDPNVPLRPSGVEWLGNIPAHWEVRRTKYVLREIDERSKTGEETHLSMSQRFGLIPSSEIEEHRLLSESYIGAKICRENDLVLNRLKAHLGVFALAKQDGLVSPDYTVLRPIVSVSVRYFEMVLRAPACRGELRKRAKGIVQGFWRLYTDDFYDIYVPFPPQSEQEHIVRKVDEESQVVETAISRAFREIDLLREYRTRLIADVVTGKLDVRKAASQLPEDLEELELVDEVDEIADTGGDKVDDFEQELEEAVI
jgi:type I restriction enzyme S subunit